MGKQIRLRVQKEKTGWRIVLCVLGMLILAGVCWYGDRRYGIIAYLKEVKTTLQSGSTRNRSERGVIYDRNLKQLAVTMEKVSVYARTREIDSISETVKSLALLLPVDETRLQDQLENGPLRVWIAEDIDQSRETSLKEKNLPGIYLQKDSRRFYPIGSHAAHIIGYVENNIGLSGVEYYYDHLLATRQLQRSDTQGSLPVSPDLVLTLDFKIQFVLEQLIEDIGQTAGVKKVGAYIIEGQGGEIVAGAQLPGFDLNDFTKYSHDILKNVFLMPVVLPDMFRIFLRDSALLFANREAGIAATSWCLSPATNNLGVQLRLWEKLALAENLAVDFSSLGPDDSLAEGGALPVFPSKRIFELVPERAAPLNILTAFASLLNGGGDVRPFVVKKIMEHGSGKEFFLKNLGQSAGVAEDEKEVKNDVARMFRSLAVQKESGALYFKDRILLRPLAEGPYYQNEMMIVKIPAGSTDLILLVVVERDPSGPQKMETGKVLSLESMVEKRVERISVLQQVALSVADVVEPEVVDESNYSLKKTIKISRFIKNEDKSYRNFSFGVMPDLEGLSLRKSLRMLQGLHLKINLRGTGRVISQEPRPGTPLKQITECILILEKEEDMQFEKISRELSKE